MFKDINMSLEDLLGHGYAESVASANQALGVMSRMEAEAWLSGKVSFFSEAEQKAEDTLLPLVGHKIAKPFENANDGAPTDSFRKAENKSASPVTGRGPFRVGEDGQLYLTLHSPNKHLEERPCFHPLKEENGRLVRADALSVYRKSLCRPAEAFSVLCAAYLSR